MIMISRRMLWILLGLALVLLAVLAARAGVAVDARASAPLLVPLIVTLSLPLWPGARTSGQQRLSDALELMALFMLVSGMGALASYAVAAESAGYVDAQLAAIDRALGFDWVKAYEAIATRPWLAILSRLAYVSIFATPIAVTFALGITGQSARGRQFLLAFGLALAAALVCFYFFPARSALAHHLGTDVSYLPATGIGHLDVIEQVRAGVLAPVTLGSLAGLITFPSFHAAAAVLFIWAGSSVPVLRWPVLAVNLAMLAATPVEGTHYFVDVIGGVALAGLALGALHLPALVGPALGGRLHALHAGQ